MGKVNKKREKIGRKIHLSQYGAILFCRMDILRAYDTGFGSVGCL